MPSAAAISPSARPAFCPVHTDNHAIACNVCDGPTCHDCRTGDRSTVAIVLVCPGCAKHQRLHRAPGFPLRLPRWRPSGRTTVIMLVTAFVVIVAAQHAHGGTSSTVAHVEHNAKAYSRSEHFPTENQQISGVTATRLTGPTHVLLRPSGDDAWAMVVQLHNGTGKPVHLLPMIDIHSIKRDGVVSATKISGIHPGTGEWNVDFGSRAGQMEAITARTAGAADSATVRSIAAGTNGTGTYGADDAPGPIDVTLQPGMDTSVFVLVHAAGDGDAAAAEPAPTGLEYSYTPDGQTMDIWKIPISTAAAG